MGADSVVLVGVSTRAFAQSAVRAGFEVTGVDCFGDLDQRALVRTLTPAADTGDACDVRRLVELARAQPAGAVAYVAPFENHPDAVAVLAAGRELLGNPPETLAAVRDPHRLAEVVSAAGEATPAILPPGARPDPALRWLRKRRRSGGGLGIEAWTGVVPDDRESIVQRWVDGSPHSAAFVANGRDALVFAVTRQLCGDPNFGTPGFVYTGNLLKVAPDPALVDRLARLAAALTRSFGLVGLNGIDFMLAGTQPVVLEVNPRYSASMEVAEQALGAPLFEWHVAGCRGEPIPALPRRGRTVFGKAIVYARRDVTLGETAGWPARNRRDVPHPGATIRAGHPICTLVAAGTSEAECYAALVARAVELKREIHDD